MKDIYFVYPRSLDVELLKSDRLFAPPSDLPPAPPPTPPPPPPKKKQSFCPLNRIESTFNRIESSDQLILVFLIETFLNNFFSIVIESSSIRFKKIANRNPLLFISQKEK
jgi:hypothetical protein